MRMTYYQTKNCESLMMNIGVALQTPVLNHLPQIESTPTDTMPKGTGSLDLGRKISKNRKNKISGQKRNSGITSLNNNGKESTMKMLDLSIKTNTQSGKRLNRTINHSEISTKPIRKENLKISRNKDGKNELNGIKDNSNTRTIPIIEDHKTKLRLSPKYSIVSLVFLALPWF